MALPGFTGVERSVDDDVLAILKGPKPAAKAGITYHNTGVPNIARAKEIGLGKYVKNCGGYYERPKSQGGMGWNSGPHRFVGHDGGPYAKSMEGTPLDMGGTHSPSWNGTGPNSRVGIEMIADFRGQGAPSLKGRASDDDDFGSGQIIKIGTCRIGAAVLFRMGLPVNDKTVMLHKEDRATDHDCPGRDIEKKEMVELTRQFYDELRPAGDLDPNKPIPMLAEIVKPVAKKARTTTDDLNVRSGAGTGFPIIETLAKGAPLDVYGSAANGTTTWLSVVTATGKEGWVSSKFVLYLVESGGKIIEKPVAQPLTRPQQGVLIMVREGWRPLDGFGSMGNAMQESYRDLKVDVIGDAGLAHGIMQWQDSRDPKKVSRFDQLVSFAAKRGKPWTDFETQVLFWLHELGTTEARAGAKMKAARNVTESTQAAMSALRPGTPHFERRLQYARELEAWWNARGDEVKLAA